MSDSIDLSQRDHRRLIGGLGLALPVLLYLVAGLRPAPPLPRWSVLHSVSAYYHTGAVAIFVGILFSLSLFLFTYRGYEDTIADRVVARIGGAAAFVVAVFPTGAPENVAAPQWWNVWIGRIHYGAAIVLFITFIIFASWLFRKSDIEKRSERPRDKQIRDHVFFACAVVMGVGVVWAMTSLITHEPIFVPESIAIIAFAVSWLVKGEIQEPVTRVTQRVVQALSPDR